MHLRCHPIGMSRLLIALCVVLQAQTVSVVRLHPVDDRAVSGKTGCSPDLKAPAFPAQRDRSPPLAERLQEGAARKAGVGVLNEGIIGNLSRRLLLKR